MAAIVAQAIGALVFLVGTVLLGRRTRRLADRGSAERASRVSHLLFWVALILPGAIGLVYPGLTRYDRLLGLPGLPLRPLWIALGLASLGAGLWLMGAANRGLLKRGGGAAAFALTERLVRDGVYGRTRNPMSLGYYLGGLGLGMMAGSLSVTLAVLLVILPIHVFNLKYFEESELELRYGPSYIEYRRAVPFLVPRLRGRRTIRGTSG